MPLSFFEPSLYSISEILMARASLMGWLYSNRTHQKPRDQVLKLFLRKSPNDRDFLTENLKI